MEDSEWKIKYIDTSIMANSFAKLLEKGGEKTYFLQGRWGSGKTQYLENVARVAKKELNFIYLTLWKPKDEEGFARKLFSAVHPKVDKVVTITGYVFVALTILCSLGLAIKGFFQRNLPNNVFMIVTVVAVLITNIFNLTKNKLINIDKILMSWSIKTLKKSKGCCPNVLIIDDFDRLGKKTQRELFKLFNAIHADKKSSVGPRIIFVGDLNNILSYSKGYLSKIIDQIITLPYNLKAENFAFQIDEIIQKKLKVSRAFYYPLQSIFIEENRTLRDANKFLYYAQNEFKTQKKEGRVHVSQQLVIIYLFLFHKDIYEKILNSSTKKVRIIIKNKTLLNCCNVLLYKNSKLSLPFFSDKKNFYYINEMATNYPLAVLYSFINNTPVLDNILKFRENRETKSKELERYYEFENYINHMSTHDFSKNSEQLMDRAISIMHEEIRHTPNKLILEIFLRKLNELENQKGSPFETLEKKLSKKISDFCERIYIYRVCLPLVYGQYSIVQNEDIIVSSLKIVDIVNAFKEVAKEREMKNSFGKNNYDAEALLVQLGLHYPSDNGDREVYDSLKLDTIQSKVSSIEKLKDSEYVEFWYQYTNKKIESGKIEYINFKYKGKNYIEVVLNNYRIAKNNL